MLLRFLKQLTLTNRILASVNADASSCKDMMKDWKGSYDKEKRSV